MSRRIGSEPGQIGWWTWSSTFRVGSDRFGAPSDRRSVRSDTGCRSGCRYKLSGRRDRERGRRDRERGRRDKISGRRSRGRGQRDKPGKKNDSEAEQSALEPKRMPSTSYRVASEINSKQLLKTTIAYEKLVLHVTKGRTMPKIRLCIGVRKGKIGGIQKAPKHLRREE